MISGIHLTLLIGPIVPIPAPRVVVDSLESVTVTTSSGSRSGFQLSFLMNSRSELNTIFLIAAGQSASVGTPPLRVLLIVTINGVPQPLFDGVMTNVEVQPGQDGGAGSISITGEDVSKPWTCKIFQASPFRPCLLLHELPLFARSMRRSVSSLSPYQKSF